MKRPFVLTFLLILLNQMISAQEIALSTTFSHSSYNKFKNNIGYEVGYNQFVKLNSRMGFGFSHSFNNTDYSYIFMSDADGMDYHRAVKPNNQKLTLSFNYSFNVLNRQQSKFYIGPKLGLNYFHVREFVDESPVNSMDSYQYHSNHWETNKLGIGVLLEYQRNVFTENISVFISSEPEVIFYSQFGLVGSSAPVMVACINFNLGFKYDIK